MHENIAYPERKQKQNDKDRQHIYYTACRPYPENDHHHTHYTKGYHHLKPAHQHPGQQQDKFRHIDLCNDRTVASYQVYTAGHTSGKEIPHRQTDKNKYRKIPLRRMKHHPEHHRVDQHHAHRLDQPPQPVQIRIGHLRPQIRPGRANRVTGIVPDIIKELPHTPFDALPVPPAIHKNTDEKRQNQRPRTSHTQILDLIGQCHILKAQIPYPAYIGHRKGSAVDKHEVKQKKCRLLSAVKLRGTQKNMYDPCQNGWQDEHGEMEHGFTPLVEYCIVHIVNVLHLFLIQNALFLCCILCNTGYLTQI